MGRAVRQLHSIHFPGFGELSANGTIVSNNAYLAALAERAKTRIKKTEHAALFCALLSERASLFRSVKQPGLCHEDLHKHNILFDFRNERWQLSAILDFDSTWAGSYESDLARLELWRGMVGPGFWEGYGRQPEESVQYAERRLIHQLMWCLEYASPVPAHVADTRRICDALGLAPINNFE